MQHHSAADHADTVSFCQTDTAFWKNPHGLHSGFCGRGSGHFQRQVCAQPEPDRRFALSGLSLVVDFIYFGFQVSDRQISRHVHRAQDLLLRSAHADSFSGHAGFSHDLTSHPATTAGVEPAPLSGSLCKPFLPLPLRSLHNQQNH